MRVVMPYTMVNRAACDALPAMSTEFVNVSADPLAYWRLLALLWGDAEDFTLIEHDVVIAPGTLAALDACPEPWCSCPQPNAPRWSRKRQATPPKHSPLTGTDDRNGWSSACLQVNRFRRELMLAEPDLISSVAEPNRYWLVLDEHTVGRLRQRCHVHHELPTNHVPAVPRARDHAARRAAYVEWALSNFTADEWISSANGSLEAQKRRAEASRFAGVPRT